MRARALVPAAAVVAALAAPTPAHAAGCGGPWTAAVPASCTFTVPAGTKVLIQSNGVHPALTGRGAYAAVSVMLGSTTLHSCSGYGGYSASCSATFVLPYNTTYTCRGGGQSSGTYSCAATV